MRQKKNNNQNKNQKKKKTQPLKSFTFPTPVFRNLLVFGASDVLTSQDNFGFYNAVQEDLGWVKGVFFKKFLMWAVIIRGKVGGEPINTWTTGVFSGRVTVWNSPFKRKVRIWNWFPWNDLCLCTEEKSLAVTSQLEDHSFWTYFRIRFRGVLYNGHTTSP